MLSLFLLQETDASGTPPRILLEIYQGFSGLKEGDLGGKKDKSGNNRHEHLVFSPLALYLAFGDRVSY